jgi:uncharacterized membrane protein
MSQPIPDIQNKQASNGNEAVWTFRGYEMRPSEFNTAMVHYYRAEIQRSNVWRQRLDTTTNWAVVTTGAAISFALSSPNNHFGLIILNTMLVTLFLWMEARRYRYYELWSHRARLMETDFFAHMLVPPFGPSSDWAENLAESLLQPDFPISMWEAFGRRLRRNYLWIFLILGAAWLLKTYLHPTPALDLAEFARRSALGQIPGWAVIGLGVIYNGVLFVLGIFTSGLQQAEGEVLAKWGEDVPVFNRLWDTLEVRETETAMQSNVGRRKDGGLQSRRRKQLLALIISPKSEVIAQRILKEMRRGVTGLSGRGMYTNRPSEVLMVAVTVTEMPQLKELVKSEDGKAFLIVTPVQEVVGRGFQAAQA